MSGELVTVATFHDPVEAALARNFLEDSLIRAYLLDAEMGSNSGGLGAAIGGVKLQVHAADTEKARFLLSQLPAQHADAAHFEGPITAFANAETIEELRAEREILPPKDDAVDRLFRATVLGLIIWPIQIYALWLLITLPAVPGEMSPNRRWKVWVSVPLNVPLLAAIYLSLSCVAGLLSR